MGVLYDPGASALLTGDARWERDPVRVLLLATSYEFSPDHTEVDLAPHVAGTSEPLGGCIVAGRTARAKPGVLLADREVKCAAVAVTCGGTLLVYSPDLPPLQPLKGQRVDVRWPDNTVFEI